MRQQFFILGCGKMGSALLNGWLEGSVGGDERYDFIIIDPFFDKTQLKATSDRVSAYASFGDAAAAGHEKADIMLLSVKPQMMAEALSQAQSLNLSSCLFISIAAGLSLHSLAQSIGADKTDAKLPRIIRTMPNTPAAIGKGMTAVIGNEATNEADLGLAQELLAVSGKVVMLADEAQLDAVTALSGSGPAYVFLLAEVMAQAGKTLGLSEEMARQLAEQTIYGAGALLEASDEPAATLRQNVTSKGGTTAAALEILMAADGMADLLDKAMTAAHQRSVELGKG